MMDAGEMLGRATASGTRYEVYVGGGVVSFTQAEVGAVLAGWKHYRGKQESLPEGAYRVLILRYAAGGEVDLRALVRELVADGGRGTGWESRAARTSMCKAAIHEFLAARRCEDCDGRQTVMSNNLVVTCSGCEGTGYRQDGPAARSDRVGLPLATFRGGPAERFYIDRLRRLSEWEDIGLRWAQHMNRAGYERTTL